MAQTKHCDLAIAGGGLAGSLIALALAARRPNVRVLLVDEGETIGGNHIWSFFHNDVADADRWLLAPLVGHGWQGYNVAFPGRRRKLGTPYYSILSERLDAVVRRTLRDDLVMTGRRITALNKTTLLIEGGDRVQAKAVIDARGPGDLGQIDCGWQKFVGQVVRLESPHGLERPVVMDATVDQIDGYRFVYVLPLDADRLLIEDTYYSDAPLIDLDAVTARIADYATAKGWAIAEVERQETGVLPVALGGDFDAYWQSGAKDVAKAGVRAGLFHPTTGYSLPDAVRTAMFVAGLPSPASRTLHDVMREHARATWEERGFYRMLGRMLFRAAEPERRYRVMQRFYGLDRALIERFYAAQSTGMDRFRILAGRPPVPVLRAIRLMGERTDMRA
ncbi:lycopene beta-cyclase [Sphingomonas laterariae]|uniref:Lycopene beta-cyclase n=1 Tax=Edaphosphingomonas laterariae TaxID=861865 RepID=A0A239BTE7_9SPHN|nr:lycopene beta-cyclase CrtY [Sphingomonas laterariae]SNS10711.1 lycopene beta-cyclase [Sphingomonas laterariae]